MNTLKIDDKWSVEYDTDDLDRPYTALRYGMANHGNQPSKWGDCEHAMFYALLEAREVRNETAEADRPLEPPRDYSDLGMTSEAGAAFELMCEDRDATEGTHIHAALLAQDATGLLVTGLNAEEMEELRVLGQRTGGLIEVVPGKRKPMDSAGDVRREPDFAALAVEIHADNVRAGWWTDLNSNEDTRLSRNRPEMLMLAVTELAEAAQGADGLPDDKLPHLLMYDVELADFVIRQFDQIGAEVACGHPMPEWGGNHEHCRRIMRPISRGDRLMELLILVSNAMEHHRKGRTNDYIRVMANSVWMTFVIADVEGIDLLDMIEQKRAFNRTRPDHKIENRRGPNGKRI